MMSGAGTELVLVGGEKKHIEARKGGFSLTRSYEFL